MLGPVSPQRQFAPISPSRNRPPLAVQAPNGLLVSPFPSPTASPTAPPRPGGADLRGPDGSEASGDEDAADVIQVDMPTGLSRRISITGTRASDRPGFSTAASDALQNLQQLDNLMREQLADSRSSRSAADDDAKRRLVEDVTEALHRPLEQRSDEENELLRTWVRTLDLKDERMQALRKNHVDALVNAMAVSAHKPGAVLFRQDATGDDMHIVMTGAIGMFRRADGKPDMAKAIADAHKMARFEADEDGSGARVDLL